MFDLKNILDALNAAQAASASSDFTRYAPEKERSLCAGALLMLNSNCEPRSLATGFGAQMMVSTLMSAWHIANADDLRKTIEVLLVEGQHLGMDPAIVDLQAMAKSGADELAIYHRLVDAFGIEDAQALYQVEHALVQNISAQDPAWVDMCDIHAATSTLRAWDIERAAFNARMGFEAGYIDEEEAFSVLERCRALAESTYGSWRDYSVAFVLGRIIGYTYDCEALVGALSEALAEPQALFNVYPLGA